MGRQLYILIQFARKNILLADSKWINWAYHEGRLIMIDLGSVTFKRLKNEFRGIAEHAMASFASAPPQFAGWASNWLAEKTKLAAPNKLPSHDSRRPVILLTSPVVGCLQGKLAPRKSLFFVYPEPRQGPTHIQSTQLMRTATATRHLPQLLELTTGGRAFGGIRSSFNTCLQCFTSASSSK